MPNRKATDDAASEVGTRRRASTSRGKRTTRSSSRETSMAPTEISDGESGLGSDEDEILPKSRRVTRGKQMSKVVEEDEEGETETVDGATEGGEGEDDVESMLDTSF